MELASDGEEITQQEVTVPDVTGIYYGVDSVGLPLGASIPDQHSFWAITYNDGSTQFIEYGPSNGAYGNLTQQYYDHSGWSPNSPGTTDYSSLASGQYGSLNAAGDALAENSAILAQNLIDNGVGYGYGDNNCNTASWTLGEGTFGIVPDVNGATQLGSDAGSLGSYLSSPAGWQPDGLFVIGRTTAINDVPTDGWCYVSNNGVYY